jgi:hypothetical protein
VKIEKINDSNNKKKGERRKGSLKGGKGKG